MSINWKALKEQKNVVTPFFSIILGPSGAGKSTLIGTLKKPTLYLYTSAEDHGPRAATASGGMVTALCLNMNENGEELSADDTYAKLMDIISDKTLGDHFEAIALDSITELDLVIRKTKLFATACRTDKGTHNQWAESGAVITLMKKVIDGLKAHHRTGTHVLVTCAAVVKTTDETGGISECAPKLLGYETASDVIRHFGDVLLVNRLNLPDEAGEIQPVHALSFRAAVTKMSKDMKGNILKTVNFQTRITGLLVDELPAVMKADLSQLLDIKNGKRSG